MSTPFQPAPCPDSWRAFFQRSTLFAWRCLQVVACFKTQSSCVLPCCRKLQSLSIQSQEHLSVSSSRYLTTRQLISRSGLQPRPKLWKAHGVLEWHFVQTSMRELMHWTVTLSFWYSTLWSFYPNIFWRALKGWNLKAQISMIHYAMA